MKKSLHGLNGLCRDFYCLIRFAGPEIMMQLEWRSQKRSETSKISMQIENELRNRFDTHIIMPLIDYRFRRRFEGS